MGREIVVIGASLGGYHALAVVLGGLPAAFPVPVVVAQHRAPQSGEPLKVALQKKTALKLREAQDKEAPRPGYAYLAPADYHLLVQRGCLSLSTEAPVNSARPSLDVLFESASDAYGAATLAVVLTGASRDGAAGAALIKRRGGAVIVQDPETAESAVMPRAAIQIAAVDHVAPLAEIPALIQRYCSPCDA